MILIVKNLVQNKFNYILQTMELEYKPFDKYLMPKIIWLCYELTSSILISPQCREESGFKPGPVDPDPENPGTG